MGITGLIPFLEKASKRVHLKELRGSTIAVDTYCWLHKGAFGCAEKLARGEETDVYVAYCMRYVQLMLSHDIKPILVFDGRHLPAKALTESRRRETRKAARKQAAELMRQGRYDEGRSQLRRSVDVTHEMALRVIRECHDCNVDCIVAPYEADAQMAWLNKAGVAQYIVTEDSDLTLFGAQNVIFKLDMAGAGLLVEASKLHLAMGCRVEKYTFDKFRRMCILSGCDYLDSLPGIGLSKACKFMLMTEEDDMWRALRKVPQYLKLKQLEVTDEYIESFLKAEATFKHMYIYNPLERKMQRLHELHEFETDERYCANAGSLLDNEEQALQLALGNLNPFTLKPLDNWHPDRVAFAQTSATKKSSSSIKRAKHPSIWQSACSPGGSKKASSGGGGSKRAAGLVSCALYFKKVDFISKTIDADISANMRAEIAKPQEAEIYTLYRREAAIKEHCATVEPPGKRQRRSSSTTSTNTSLSVTDNEDNNNNSKAMPPSTTPIKSHNPFARVYDSLEERLRKSPVCDSSSLLRALSPKKLKEKEAATTTTQLVKSKLANVKRSIFDPTNVVVKSRLFATNRQEVHNLHQQSAVGALDELSATNDQSIDGDDQIDEIIAIETKAQIHRQNVAQLYHSPSPTKAPSAQECGRSVEDNKNSTPTKCEIVIDGDVDEDIAIVLSEDDDEAGGIDDKLQRVGVQSIRPLEISTFKSQASRHLGLVGRKKSAAKKSTITPAAGNQTRLSMFGFQKRPTMR